QSSFSVRPSCSWSTSSSLRRLGSARALNSKSGSCGMLNTQVTTYLFYASSYLHVKRGAQNPERNSVRHREVGPVNHQRVDGGPPRFQLQAELLAKGGEDRPALFGIRVRHSGPTRAGVE